MPESGHQKRIQVAYGTPPELPHGLRLERMTDIEGADVLNR